MIRKWLIAAVAAAGLVAWLAADDTQCLPLFADRPYLPLCR